MKTFEFTIVASGLDLDADDFEDRFFEAGCDDATIAVTRGAVTLQFARESNSLAAAIDSAIAAVTKAGAEVRGVPLQTESAGDFIRQMRDSDRY